MLSGALSRAVALYKIKKYEKSVASLCRKAQFLRLVREISHDCEVDYR